MKERSAGGKGVSGRYRKHDSARVRCLERLIEPRLKMGMLPTSYDETMLFEYPGPDDIDGPAKQEMDAWSDIHYRHPRKGNTAATAAARADAAMPLDDQTALLNWLRIDGPGSVARHRVRAPAGRPRTAFRISKILPGSEWKDHTIAQLKHESNRSRAIVQWSMAVPSRHQFRAYISLDLPFPRAYRTSFLTISNSRRTVNAAHSNGHSPSTRIW